MLLVVCPNLSVDRILDVPNFKATQVQRSRSVILQPGGKGSNVARVFNQLGGKVVLTGFVGRQNGSWIVNSLRRSGVEVDAVAAFPGDSRTCTIICDSSSQNHPTVINEESPEIELGSASKLLGKIEKWIPRVDAVLTTGSLALGLPVEFYAEILDRAKSRGKLTAIDAAGQVLRAGMLARPVFMKPNLEEFREFAGTQPVSMLAPQTAVTFGEAGAVLFYGGTCIYAAPPRVERTNPIGAGDAFVAGYLRRLLSGGSPEDWLRLAVSAAAGDAATVRPGSIDYGYFRTLLPHARTKVAPTFQV